jgi:hypothetical protein
MRGSTHTSMKMAVSNQDSLIDPISSATLITVETSNNRSKYRDLLTKFVAEAKSAIHIAI